MTAHPVPSSLPLGLRPSDALTAAVVAVLTLPDPARRSAAGRFALRTAVAATTGVAVWAGTAQDPELEHDVAQRVAFTVGGVGLAYGAAELGEALDRALQRRLRRMGVGRPRAVMAVVGGGLSLAMSVLDRRAQVDAADEDTLAGPTVHPLSPHVRDLVSGILEQTEDYDSLRLRAQLAVATETRWSAGTDPRVVELAVTGDVPLAVPHDVTFPVSARFTSPRGVPCTVRLQVADGLLAAVVVDVEQDAWAPLAEGWDPRGGDEDPLADVALPRVQDVTFVMETSGRG